MQEINNLKVVISVYLKYSKYKYVMQKVIYLYSFLDVRPIHL